MQQILRQISPVNGIIWETLLIFVVVAQVSGFNNQRIRTRFFNAHGSFSNTASQHFPSSAVFTSGVIFPDEQSAVQNSQPSHQHQPDVLFPDDQQQTDVMFPDEHDVNPSSQSNVIFTDQLPRVYTSRQPRQTMIPSLNQCGRTSAEIGTENKVQKIKPGDFPWLAAVGKLKNQIHFTVMCGGTLITNRHVLSAAHCFLQTKKLREDPPTHVRLGEYDVRMHGDGAQDYRIVDKHTFDYDGNYTHFNDIILLKLDRHIEFNDRIAPACLPFQLPESEYFKKRLTVVGWGKTTKSSERSIIAHREEPEHVPLKECQESYKTHGDEQPITNNNICAGRGKADACQGHSGGALNFRSSIGRNAGRVFVVGIVSFGPGNCGDSTLPGVYTNVAKYNYWIKRNLN